MLKAFPLIVKHLSVLSAAKATIELESSPPDKNAPTGTSETIWPCTDCLNAEVTDDIRLLSSNFHF